MFLNSFLTSGPDAGVRCLYAQVIFPADSNLVLYSIWVIDLMLAADFRHFHKRRIVSYNFFLRKQIFYKSLGEFFSNFVRHAYAVKNVVLFILTFSIFLAGFSQAIDVLSFRVQKFYVSVDHLPFAKGNIVYCGDEEVLNKKLDDHSKSSNNANDEGKTKLSVQLFQQEDKIVLPFTEVSREKMTVPSRMGIVIRRSSDIFHPPC